MFDDGLEAAGLECVGQCEFDTWRRGKLFAKRPHVHCWPDVRLIVGDEPELEDLGLVIGGPPCQPASQAGRQKGSMDDRWLWSEFNRIVRRVRPRWFIAENPLGFLDLPDAGRVIGQLEGSGYEVWPVVLGACHFGAPMHRHRVWFVGRLDDAARAGRQGSKRSGIHRSAPGEERIGFDAGGAVHIAWPQGPGEIDSIPAEVDGLAPGLVRGERSHALRAIGDGGMWFIPYLIGQWIVQQESESVA